MVLKITVIVIGVLIAFGLLVVGTMAGMGVTFKVDFSSPGPIQLPAKPVLQTKEPAPTETNQSFRFAN